VTLGELYRRGKSVLLQSGNESPAFDAAFLFQKAFSIDRQSMIVYAQEKADTVQEKQYLAWIAERAEKRPLQYIVGQWPFMELNLSVGEGVLIPREETELLVYTAAQLLKNEEKPTVLDLCAGTGAVALGLASLLPSAQITAVELYDMAFSYLSLNIRQTGYRNVMPARLDILNPMSAEHFSSVDCILSNPPYINTGELPVLQTEVQREPLTALDGGSDGLAFYRAIASVWLPKLKTGGTAAVEIGEGQAKQVAALFQSAGLTGIQAKKDFNGIERVVAGTKS
jgi:release factor glutamine methyltransferase